MKRCGILLSPHTVAELNQLFADELEVSGMFWNNLNIKQWESPVGLVEIGQYHIVPLTTPKKVKSEGYLMQNCVRQYVDICSGGKYLLFSIRNFDGERVATLGVKNLDDHWYLDSCLGRENTTVMEKTFEVTDDGNVTFEIDYTELFSVAHEVVRLLNNMSSIRQAV